MRRTSSAFLAAAALGLAWGWPAPPAAAQPIEGIAAVVDEQAVSLSDVDARLRLTLLSAGLPVTDELRAALEPQVVRALIDEAVQRQEAERLGIVVDPAEVDEALSTIAAQNDLTADAFTAMMADSGIPASSVEDQIRDQIAWHQVVRRSVLPSIQVTEEEIDDQEARVAAATGQPEHLVADLYLAVDEPSNDAEVRAFAERLMAIMQGGARFSPLARAFSQGAQAAGGGDLGWVLPGQLEPALDQAIAGLEVGGLAGPIRTTAGYHILLLRDRRLANMPDELAAEVDLLQLALGFPPQLTQEQRQGILNGMADIARSVRGCDALEARAREVGIDRGLTRGSGTLRALQPEVRDAVMDLAIGQPTAPQRLPGGVAILMICARGEPPPAVPPTREDILRTLTEQRADLLQRRLLRDLRSAAFIERRT